MITLIIATSFKGTRTERIKALAWSIGIDCLVILGCLPFLNCIDYTR